MPVRDLGRLKLSDVLFWVLAGVSAVLLVVLALILSGVIPIDSGSQSEGAPANTVERRPTASWVGSKSIDVTVDGAPAELAPGTVSVVLPDGATSAANAAR